MNNGNHNWLQPFIICNHDDLLVCMMVFQEQKYAHPVIMCHFSLKHSTLGHHWPGIILLCYYVKDMVLWYHSSLRWSKESVLSLTYCTRSVIKIPLCSQSDNSQSTQSSVIIFMWDFLAFQYSGSLCWRILQDQLNELAFVAKCNLWMAAICLSSECLRKMIVFWK